jgi:tRNA nucleotidyltransferase (CCA-adding enzyme)
MPPMLDPSRIALLDVLRALPAGGVILRALPPEFEPAVQLVGGAVRDLLLGGAPSDLDLVVEGSAGALAAVLGGSVRSSYDRFGTLSATLDGSSFDIASARRERYPYPGALPDVEPAGLDQDLLRRDFTVNAIALALTGGNRGGLQSVPDALGDLRLGLLRVLHDRSFVDDPTRLLRLARYNARLHFAIEPLTLRLATEALRGGALGTVSGPRIGNELRAITREADAVSAFEALHRLGIDGAIAPGFGLGPNEARIARQALELLPTDGRIDVLTLALSGHSLDSARLGALLDRLAFEAPVREAILDTAARYEPLACELRDAARPSDIADAVGGGSVELVAIAGAMGASSAARLWIEQLRFVTLAIDGRDLLAAGIREGPAVGVGLRAALVAALDGAATDRGRQLEVALRAAQGSG